MFLRRVVTIVIAALSFTAAARAQDLTEPDSVVNWAAPPYWSAPAKPAGDKEGVGMLESEIADVVPSPPMPFVATNPCRIADTRGLGFSGQAGPPALSVGVTRVFQITGTVAGVTTQCGIPAGAEAVSFQFSVTGMNSGGNLIAWPDGPPPTTSVLNWNASSVAIGNGIVVPLNGTGGVSVQLNGLAGAITHLIIDVNGYYAPVGIVNTVNGLSGAVTLAQGSNITITPSGQTLTIANTAPAAWSLSGNAGTTAGPNFVGTTDGQPLEIRVAGNRIMRFETNSNVNGGCCNSITAGAASATIAGGGNPPEPNRVTDYYGVVGGGSGNRAGNNAGSTFDASYATVGGGWNNIAAGAYSAIPGGRLNSASGLYGFAAGRRAQSSHDGAFVWGDSTDANVSSTGANQFLVRANGGATFLRGVASVATTTAAGLSVHHSGSGEGAWLWTSSSTNTYPVVTALKHPTATNNFFECWNFDGMTTAPRCHITSAGTFVAGSDFAEAFPAKGGKAELEPGDVLVLSSDTDGVERSSKHYDTRAIGVYSTRPGFLGADKAGETRVDPDDVPVAITGIVPTKVTAENGAISRGDLLTTSSTPGHAMKATPINVAGVDVYPPGTIIGKALQPFDGEAGVIRVLVQGR